MPQLRRFYRGQVWEVKQDHKRKIIQGDFEKVNPDVFKKGRAEKELLRELKKDHKKLVFGPGGK